MQALTLNCDTKRLSASYFFSKSGEFAFETAFSVAVVTLTEADFLLIGLIYFFRYLPSALFSPIGGWLADNIKKKSTLVIVELLKCVIAIMLFFLFKNTIASVPLLIVISMLMTALDCLYTPAFRAYLPEIVENDHLASANSGIQIIEDISSIIGPLIFSFITILFAPSYTFLFFSTCLLASVAFTLTLKSSQKIASAPFNLRAIVQDATRNIENLKNFNAPLFTVICCTTFCALFATSVVRFILPTAIIETFKSEAVVGYLLSLMAFGTVLGGSLYVKFNPKTTVQSVTLYWRLYGILFLITAVALKLNVYLFFCLLLCVGFIGAFVDIAIITNIQHLSNRQEVGKNFSLYYLTALMGDALSGLMASLMFLFLGTSTFIGMTFMLSIAPLGWSIRRNDTNKDNL